VVFDRSKDVMILSTRPFSQYLETRLKFSPSLRMFGDRRPAALVSAVICIDYTVVGKWRRTEHLIPVIRSFQKPQVYDLVLKEIVSR
jgi:hypothetical protein